MSTSNLVDIRQRLIDVAIGRGPTQDVDVILYEADPADTTDPAAIVMKPRFALPRRTRVGHEGEPLIHQAGRFVVQLEFPPGTGFLKQHQMAQQVANAFGEQVLGGYVNLSGDCEILNRGKGFDVPGNDAQRRTSGPRTMWEVAVPWSTIARETMLGDSLPVVNLTTEDAALLVVRSVWEQRIQAALVAENWPGIPTRWDYLPDVATPPSLPWAGYWIQAGDRWLHEVQGASSRVIGRALVQLHTAPRGYVPTLQILERILAEHNRQLAGVTIGPVEAEAQFRSPAATLQTNLRIPFYFERAR